MKIKAILSLFAIIGFIIFQLGNKTTVADSTPDILKIAGALEAEDILLKEWSVYSRENIGDSNSSGELEKYAAELQDKLPGWEWSITSTGRTWEASAVSPASEYGREYLQLISSRTPQKADAYIIYKVIGGKWNEKSAAFMTQGKFNQRLDDIFRGEPSIFSCVKGTFDDKMKKALPKKVTGIMDRLNAEETEALREKDFISVSAMSPVFADVLKAGMNVQIAVRSTGEEASTVTVGTPIITVEY